jgi:hypothetical protein
MSIFKLTRFPSKNVRRAVSFCAEAEATAASNKVERTRSKEKVVESFLLRCGGMPTAGRILSRMRLSGNANGLYPCPHSGQTGIFKAQLVLDGTTSGNLGIYRIEYTYGGVSPPGSAGNSTSPLWPIPV